MSASPNTSLTVKASIQAPTDKVWKLWNTPENIQDWNAATADWFCPKAQNDLKEGGRFVYTMAARDGSMSFDFAGVYKKIKPKELIHYVLDDGRKVTVTFSDQGDSTEVVEVFEAEGSNSLEMQQAGWQAILNSFKSYAERNTRMETLHFEIEIQAPVSKVAGNMLGEKTYAEWTAEFNPTSRYLGSWQKGSKMLFIGTDKDGNDGGMVSRIKEHIPNLFVSIEHLGMVHKGREITSGPEVEGWAGALENYSFTATSKGTRVSITLDSNGEFKDYFSEAWPRALNKLKQICE